jgi:hypothetical protein
LLQQFRRSVLENGEGINQYLTFLFLPILFGFDRAFNRQLLGQVIDDSGEEVVALALYFRDGEVDWEEGAGFLLAAGLTTGADYLFLPGFVVGLDVWGLARGDT